MEGPLASGPVTIPSNNRVVRGGPVTISSNNPVVRHSTVTGRLASRPYTSTASATPLPPPRHSDAMPRFAPRRFIAYSSVVRTRAPEAPIG